MNVLEIYPDANVYLNNPDAKECDPRSEVIHEGRQYTKFSFDVVVDTVSRVVSICLVVAAAALTCFIALAFEFVRNRWSEGVEGVKKVTFLVEGDHLNRRSSENSSSSSSTKTKSVSNASKSESKSSSSSETISKENSKSSETASKKSTKSVSDVSQDLNQPNEVKDNENNLISSTIKKVSNLISPRIEKSPREDIEKLLTPKTSFEESDTSTMTLDLGGSGFGSSINEDIERLNDLTLSKRLSSPRLNLMDSIIKPIASRSSEDQDGLIDKLNEGDALDSKEFATVSDIISYFGENCDKVFNLDLQNFSEIEDEDIEKIQNSFSNIQHLLVIGKKLTNDSVKHFKKMQSLESLSLVECKEITDFTFLTEIVNLSSVNLSLCKQIMDFSFLTNIEKLASLNLSCCDIKDFAFFKNLPKLTDLDLSWTNIVNLRVLEDCPALVRLSLWGCEKMVNISDLQYCTTLKFLDVDRSEQIYDTDIQLLNDKGIEIDFGDNS